MDTYYHNNNSNNSNNNNGNHSQIIYHSIHMSNRPSSKQLKNSNDDDDDDSMVKEEYNNAFGPYPTSATSIGRIHSYPIDILPYPSSSSLTSSSLNVKQHPTEIPQQNNMITNSAKYQPVMSTSFISIMPIELSYSRPSDSSSLTMSTASSIGESQSIRNPVRKNQEYNMEQIRLSNSNSIVNNSSYSNNNTGNRNLMNTIQNTQMLIDCCKKIWQKAKFGNDEVKKKIIEKGGAIVVLEGMKYHRDNQEVQSSACGALASLALNSENQITLAEIGAIEAIKCALKAHKMNEEVQQFGCSALMNLAANAANQLKLMKIGASNIIIDAMNNFLMNEKIQQSGCGTLGNLAGLEENRGILINMKAEQTIIDAMNNHIMDEKVQQHGCGSLMNLLINKEKEQMKINVEVVDATINAMNNYKINPTIQMHGFELLWNFAFTNNNNKIQLVQKGVIEIIINALVNHKMNEKLLQRGCSVIRSILFKTSILEALKRGCDKKLNEVTQNFIDGQLENPIAHIYSILKRLYEIKEDFERYDDYRGFENIESAVDKIDTTSLQKSLARLKESLALKMSIAQRSHLEILIDRYIALHGEKTQNVVDKQNECDCGSLNKYLSEMNKTMKKINEIEASLGKEMIAYDGNHQTDALQDLNGQRDEQRRIFHNMYNKYMEMRGKVTCIINDDCENGKELVVIENEIRKIENSLFESASTNIAMLENHGQTSNSKKMKVDENKLNDNEMPSDLEHLKSIDSSIEEMLKSDEVGIEEELSIIKNSINRLIKKSKNYHEKVLELQNNHHHSNDLVLPADDEMMGLKLQQEKEG